MSCKRSFKQLAGGKHISNSINVLVDLIRTKPGGMVGGGEARSSRADRERLNLFQASIKRSQTLRVQLSKLKLGIIWYDMLLRREPTVTMAMTF